MVFPLLQKSAGILEHCKISNSKHQITNKSQIFTLWNPPEEGRQEAAFHRAGTKWPKQVWSAEGGGSFPWQSPARHRSRSGEAGGSPGQGKNTLLRDLCASVVNLQSGFLRPL